MGRAWLSSAALGSAWSVGNVGAVVGDLSSDFDISLAAVGVLSGTVPPVLAAGHRAGAADRRAPHDRSHDDVGRLLHNRQRRLAVTPAVRAWWPVVRSRGSASAWRSWPGRSSPGQPAGSNALRSSAPRFSSGSPAGLSGAILGDLGVDWRLSSCSPPASRRRRFPALIGRAGPSYVRQAGGGFLRLALRQAMGLAPMRALHRGLFGAADPRLLARPLPERRQRLPGGDRGSAQLPDVRRVGRRSRGGRQARATRREPGAVGRSRPSWPPRASRSWRSTTSPGFAAVAAIAAGIGFAVPYGIAIVQAQRLYPTEPTEAVALVSLMGTAILVPLVPAKVAPRRRLRRGGLLTLAAMAFAGILNLRPVEGLLEPEGRAAGLGRRSRAAQ